MRIQEGGCGGDGVGLRHLPDLLPVRTDEPGSKPFARDRRYLSVPVDLDLRPFYDLIDLEHYHQYGSLSTFSRFAGPEKPYATVLSNRGCRARCTFCTVRDFNGFGVRQRSVQHVLEELEYLVHEKGVQLIDWIDDDLLFDPERSLDLFNAIRDRLPDLEWTSNNGLIGSAISSEIMEAMVRSGLLAFKIGIESGNDEMLRAIKKPATKEKLRSLTPVFRKHPGVFVSGNYILGFPNETFGQMLDTFEFANELGWDWASYYICQPLKGTEMYSTFESLGDPRCEDESFAKRAFNPGKMAQKGEFRYYKAYHADPEAGEPLMGMDVFRIRRDHVPTAEQIKEIWFTFNLMSNFLHNPNFTPSGNLDKMVRWFESIASGYPFDASMRAALCFGYRHLGDRERARIHRERFEAIMETSRYWKVRVQQFPELLRLVR